MLKYRVGYPLWKYIGRLGIPLKIEVEIFYDVHSGFFTALSEDFAPHASITAEAKKWNELISEINREITEAMDFVYRQRIPKLQLFPYLITSYSFPVGQ